MAAGISAGLNGSSDQCAILPTRVSAPVEEGASDPSFPAPSRLSNPPRAASVCCSNRSPMACPTPPHPTPPRRRSLAKPGDEVQINNRSAPPAWAAGQRGRDRVDDERATVRVHRRVGLFCGRVRCQPADPRETQLGCLRRKRTLDESHPQNRPEFDSPIDEITVDRRNAPEQLMGFSNAFDEVNFPNPGTVVGEPVEVLSVGAVDRPELTATCTRYRCRFEIALVDIDIDPNASTSHARRIARLHGSLTSRPLRPISIRDPLSIKIVPFAAFETRVTRPPISASAVGVVHLNVCSDTLHIVIRGGSVFVADGVPAILETDIRLLTPAVALTTSAPIAGMVLGPK